MALINLSQAAKITGKNRTTIWRHVKTGKLSVTKDVDNNPVVDTAELMRVYGAISEDVQHPATEQMQKAATSEMQHPELAEQISKAITQAQAPLLDKIADLVEKVEHLTNRLEHKPTVEDVENVRTKVSKPEFLQPEPVAPVNYLDDIPTFGKH